MRRKVAARATKFGDVLEEIEQLSEEEQEMLTDIIRNRLRERRREEIAKNAGETYKALKDWRARTGALDELKQDNECRRIETRAGSRVGSGCKSEPAQGFWLQSILKGKIIERQHDRLTAEYKYRISGKTLEGGKMEVIAKLGQTGKVVIITVYLVQEGEADDM